jgi:ferrous iron transport protein B
MSLAARSETQAGLATVAVCGNPNSGKTTLFNALTGLNQKVANYPGVTVERVSGPLKTESSDRSRYTVVDIPGAYSLSAFSPDEYIAAAALFGSISGEPAPDAIICVIDATNLERGLYLLLQVVQIGRPVVVALNMTDLAHKRGLKIDTRLLSEEFGGIPFVPVVGSRQRGIDHLKQETIRAVREAKSPGVNIIYDDATEAVLVELAGVMKDDNPSKAELVRVLFDVDGPAEDGFRKRYGHEAHQRVLAGREQIRRALGGLTIAETGVLTRRAQDIYCKVVQTPQERRRTFSERVDRYLLHPVLGPIILVVMMTLVFQSIFSWAAPFMGMIDTGFALLAERAAGVIPPGPLQSLVTDGIIGGVGAVLIFLPQIIILFIFIAFLEDTGYMTRAAFLVDRLFRWCGLSGKSFIPMLSSFACAVPGIMATRTIEDRKLRLITILVAPLMTCSARLPVYAIMIAAFVPYRSILGLFNLQGLVLSLLYLLGIAVAVVVSFVLSRTVFKADRGTFMMEMPTYKLPTWRSMMMRVFNRAKSFTVRAGTVIFAITVIIWALSYYPRSEQVQEDYSRQVQQVEAEATGQAVTAQQAIGEQMRLAGAEAQVVMGGITAALAEVSGTEELEATRRELQAQYPGYQVLVDAATGARRAEIRKEDRLAEVANEMAGEQLASSYFGRIGRTLQPVFSPLGWDWKITMAVLASFPAREVIIAVLGTTYNLGTEVEGDDASLINKMREARWEEGPHKGERVFTVAVAMSIMVFFALCCQCGATVVTIRQETGTWFWGVFTFAYMTTLAYLLGAITYQVFKGVSL